MYLPGYRSLQIWIVSSLTLFSLVGPPVAAETLYNGIVLPEDFPLSAEEGGRAKGKPMPVPYLDNPPTVIPIDVGRQLFVDDFLIDSTTLTRTYYTAEYHPDNPILKPDQDWEFAKDKCLPRRSAAGHGMTQSRASSRCGIRPALFGMAPLLQVQTVSIGTNPLMVW